MANVAGPGGGHTGPYWRRQLGTTLPGERSGPELQIINRLRAKQGLPPVGGSIGDNTRLAMPAGGENPVLPHMRTANPSGQTGGWRDRLLGGPTGLVAHPAPFDATQARDQVHADAEAQAQQGQGFDENPGMPGVQAMPQIQDLRDTLLARLQGNAPMLTSRDALRRYVANQPGRVARPGVGHRPILPPRPGQRAAVPARPY